MHGSRKDTIHRLRSLYERSLSAFVNAPHPVGDGRRLEVESRRCLSRVPSSGCPQFENRETLGRAIVRSPARLDASHTEVFQTQLFFEKRDLPTGLRQLCS